MKRPPCAYRVGGRSACLRPSTHVCLVERAGEDGARQEKRCEWHTKALDVIEAVPLEGQEAAKEGQ